MYRPAALVVLFLAPFSVFADEMPRWVLAFPDPTKATVIDQLATVASADADSPSYAAALHDLGIAVAERAPRMPRSALQEAVGYLETARRRQGVPVAAGRYLRDALIRRLEEATTGEIADYLGALVDLLALVFPPDSDATVGSRPEATVDSGEADAPPASRAAVAREARQTTERWYIRLTTASPAAAAELVDGAAVFLPNHAARAQALVDAYRAVDAAPQLGGPPPRGDAAPASTAVYLRRFASLHPAVAERLYLTKAEARQLIDRLSRAARSADGDAIRSAADELGVGVAELQLIGRTATFVRSGAERELRVVMEIADANVDPQLRSVSQAAIERLEETALVAVDRVSEYAAGTDPRSGDAYRWTILPVLSNPLADLDDEAEDLVSGYVTDVLNQATQAVFDRYPGAEVRVIEGPNGSTGRFVRIDGNPVVGPGDAQIRDLFYEELVIAAQGADEVPPGMRSQVVDNYRQVDAWAHSHGFHAISASPADPGRFVDQASRAWFALADAADVAVDAAALVLRGFAALAWALDQVIADFPRVDDPFAEPRVALTRELASAVADGRVLPAVGARILAPLWEAGSAADAIAAVGSRLSGGAP